MTHYEVVDRLGDGLVVIERRGHDGIRRSGWTRTTMRKAHICAVTGGPIDSGGEAYRPFGNVSYRYERIAARVIDGATMGPL